MANLINFILYKVCKKFVFPNSNSKFETLKRLKFSKPYGKKFANVQTVKFDNVNTKNKGS